MIVKVKPGVINDLNWRIDLKRWAARIPLNKLKAVSQRLDFVPRDVSFQPVPALGDNACNLFNDFTAELLLNE